MLSNFKDYERVKGLLQNTDNIESKIILAKTFAKLKEYDYAIEIFEKRFLFINNSRFPFALFVGHKYKALQHALLRC